MEGCCQQHSNLQASLFAVQIFALNELYKKEGREGVAFGRREISGEGTWTAPHDEGDLNRKTKKNMANIRCKACGQVRRRWRASEGRNAQMCLFGLRIASPEPGQEVPQVHIWGRGEGGSCSL